MQRFVIVINLFSWKLGGIQGKFLPVKKFLKIDQYVFELILGSDNFLAFFETYSCDKVSIKLNLSRLLLLFTKPFLIHKTFKSQIFIVNHFFNTASYPGSVPVMRYNIFARNEILNNI